MERYNNNPLMKERREKKGRRRYGKDNMTLMKNKRKEGNGMVKIT